MNPYTVFLQTGAYDIVPVLVVANDTDQAFGNSMTVFKNMFPKYSGVIRGIKTTPGWFSPTMYSGVMH